MGYEETLKDTMETEAEEEAKEQQQDDDYEQYDIVPKMKLVYEGIRCRMAGNFNGVNTRMIIANLTRHIEMREKVSYSFNQRSIKVLMRL